MATIPAGGDDLSCLSLFARHECHRERLLLSFFSFFLYVLADTGTAVEDNLCIAVTGTPGTGKTTICESLSELYTVVSLQELAEQNGCLEPVDQVDGSAPLDIHKLSETWVREETETCFVDGHLSHLLDVDAIVLLRCNPEKIRERLAHRSYSPEKTNANVEWELLSGTWSELLEFEIEVPILELDTTVSSSEELVESIVHWMDEGTPSASLKDAASNAMNWL